jgi:aconitate hydratase
MNYLASPPLVVAYALAGTMDIDFASEPVGTDPTGQNVYLKDLWPTEAEIASVVSNCVDPTMFTARYSSVFTGSSRWQDMVSQESIHYPWKDSTYIRRAPYFDDMSHTPAELTNITDGRILLVLGDSVTTDHISPAGSIKEDSPAGAYLRERGVEVKDFNSYGSRRGNHEVMVRGTFANIRLRNKMVPGVEGGYTLDLTQADKPMVSIFEASQGYLEQKTPLVIFAGQEYGSGSSRDWAAKGTSLLGVRAVIAQSYERIHRSNLVGMGILPLQFLEGESAETWGITGTEVISIEGLTDHLERVVDVVVDGSRHLAILRVDTPTEERYLRHGGILPYQARVMAGLA